MGLGRARRLSPALVSAAQADLPGVSLAWGALAALRDHRSFPEHGHRPRLRALRESLVHRDADGGLRRHGVQEKNKDGSPMKMNWKDLLLPPATSILETMRALDRTAAQIVLVADRQ